MGNLAIPYCESLFNLCFQLVVQPRFLISRDAASHKPNKNWASASRQLNGPHQSMGFHHPNSRAHIKVWESMVKMSKKKCEKGWKWVKVGENPKMPYPPCGRSIKTYARGNNDAPSITKYGSLVRPNAQIVALRAHCAKGAPMTDHPKRHQIVGLLVRGIWCK